MKETRINNFIRNFLYSDTVARHTFDYVKILQKQHSVVKDIYLVMSPIMQLNHMRRGDYFYDSKKSCDEQCSLSIVMRDLYFGFDNIKEDFTVDKLIKFVKPKISNDYDNEYMLYTCIIAIHSTTLEEVIDNSLSFIKECTTNGLKMLCFIGIAVFQFYAKMKANNNDNDEYDSDKWMGLLKNYVMDGNLDDRIKKIISNGDKKKFIIMLIQYDEHEMNEKLFGYTRLRDMDDCFVTKMDELPNYIPGEVPDQLFIISYDFFIGAYNWATILQDVCVSYMDNVNVNLIASFYYFTLNDTDMYNRFINDMFDNDEQTNTLAKNMDKLFLK